jgi:hypothetical protein
MLFDLTFPCYLTTFSGKKCLSGKVIRAFSCLAYRSSPVHSHHCRKKGSEPAGVSSLASQEDLLSEAEKRYNFDLQTTTLGDLILSHLEIFDDNVCPPKIRLFSVHVKWWAARTARISTGIGSSHLQHPTLG